MFAVRSSNQADAVACGRYAVMANFVLLVFSSSTLYVFDVIRRVMEQFVALRDKYGGIGDLVGGRTKVRSVPEPYII